MVTDILTSRTLTSRPEAKTCSHKILRTKRIVYESYIIRNGYKMVIKLDILK